MRKKIIILFIACFPVFFSGFFTPVRAKIIIGKESRVPSDPSQQYIRFVRFRPADGQVVTLNPPRFSWPYISTILPKKGKYMDADQHYTFQISKSENFSKPYFQVKDTTCNFYNFIPVLKGSKKWYWRIGFSTGTKTKKWSDIRSFTIADNAVSWDRSEFKKHLDSASGHPRILFNKKNRKEALNMREKNPYSEKIAKYIIRKADDFIKNKWFKNFPEKDNKKLKIRYMSLADGLLNIAFAQMLTGDKKYNGFKERFLTMASWPKGGVSSPEGIIQETDKWETHVTEYLGIFYDWFHDVLTPAERKLVRKSLEWRIDHTLNNFAYKKKDGKVIANGSIAYSCSSHPYQNTMPMIIGALAVYDEIPVAREALEIGLHYIVGITSGHGEDEAWKEGAGYGNGKMKWLMDATGYLDMSIPGLNLGKNEMYKKYRDFFVRLTPVGAQHCSFGNRGINELDWMKSRVHNLRRVAMICNDPVAMQNWFETKKRFNELGKPNIFGALPWIDYILPYYYKKPQPQREKEYTKLFPIEGWVMTSSAPPSDFKAQKDAVGMVFRCSPRGGYGHSFRNENAFDIHAYGSTITVGGGNTANGNKFVNATMSHNTILINGEGQLAAKEKQARFCGRIIAFQKGKNYTYWAGDAAQAYGSETDMGKFVRHVVFVDNTYFIIYDDLTTDKKSKKANFQWLYHIIPYVPLKFDKKNFSWHYTINDTEVLVRHLAYTEDLTYKNLRGAKGQINPVNGWDITLGDLQKYYRDGSKKQNRKISPTVDAHHIWIDHKTKRKEMNYLTAIAPYRKGEKAPEIKAIDNSTARITFRDRTKTIHFSKTGKKKDADITILVDDIYK